MTRILAPLVIGFAGIAILLWLGIWQMQRLGWKVAILDQIEETIAGAPKPLPRLVDPEAQRYQPVALTGTFEEGALRVLVSVKRQGPGYRLISPFVTDDGRRVLVDRGFVGVEAPVPATNDAVLGLEGNLHWPDDRNRSTPENDTADNIWFARDIAPMAEAFKTEPLLVIARRVSPPEQGVTPLPVDTAGIPNDHLQYAVTWFSLAGVWLIMTGVWIRRRVQGEDT